VALKHSNQYNELRDVAKMFYFKRSLLAHDFASLPSFCLPMSDGLFARMLNTNFCIVMMQRFPCRTRLDNIVGLYPVTHEIGHQMQL